MNPISMEIIMEYDMIQKYIKSKMTSTQDTRVYRTGRLLCGISELIPFEFLIEIS